MRRTWKSILGIGIAGVLASSPAWALTTFQQDVTTAIDRGIDYLDSVGAFRAVASGGSTAGEAAGLSALALLEKRRSGNPADPAQGYSGASDVDKARMRSIIGYILNNTADTTFYTQYRNGSALLALSIYLRSGGPDKGSAAEIPVSAVDLVTGINRMTDQILANQRSSGYWCYGSSYRDCNDSSTTQFAVAGLSAAKSVYSEASHADAGRLAAINAALTKARQAYVDNSGQNSRCSNGLDYSVGSDNQSCFQIDLIERGHGYHPANECYRPSLQQTASGTWIQLLGGANLNDGNVQAYIRWLRNHYRWSSLDSMGNSWPNNSYWYYLWSSFKGMEFMRLSGVTPNAGNLGPDSLGTLAPDGTCNVRQLQRDPNVLPRVSVFGAGGNGYYGGPTGEPKGQYFDYAYTILGHQCANGSFDCNTPPGSWNSWADKVPYALLVLQRATGGSCNDTDSDGICDEVDPCPNDLTNQCPKARCDVTGDKKINIDDISAITAKRGSSLAADKALYDIDNSGLIDANDARKCVLVCDKAQCAR